MKKAVKQVEASTKRKTNQTAETKQTTKQKKKQTEQTRKKKELISRVRPQNLKKQKTNVQKKKIIYGKKSLLSFCKSKKNKRDFLCVEHHGRLLRNDPMRKRGRPIGSVRKRKAVKEEEQQQKIDQGKNPMLMSEKELNDQEHGVQPEVWGPLLWLFLHILTTNYPSDRQMKNGAKETKKRVDSYKMFFKSLPGILPCGSCREHLDQNFQRLGFSEKVFESRKSISRFVFRLHNLVNSQLRKPVPRANLLETRRKYEKFRSSQTGKVPLRTLVRIVPRNCSSATFSVDPRCKN